MHVPAIAGDFNEADPGLNQTLRQQATLSELGIAIEFAGRLVLLAEIEGLEVVAAQEAQRLVVEVPVSADIAVLILRNKAFAEGVRQFEF